MRERPEILWVRWVAANSFGGWASKKEHAIKPVVCESVGFVLEWVASPGEEWEYVRLALSISESGNVQTSLAIPRCSMLEWKTLYFGESVGPTEEKP